MRLSTLIAIAVLISGCMDTKVSDVSGDPDRVSGYSVGTKYEERKDLFVYGLAYDEPLSSHEDEESRVLWLLKLTPPIGEMNGMVPESIEAWIENKERYKSIYGMAPVGTHLIVERIEEVSSLEDHLTQVLARIQDGEFSGFLVDLSWSSKVSDDHLKVTIDRDKIREFEPGSPYNSGQSLRD